MIVNFFVCDDNKTQINILNNCIDYYCINNNISYNFNYSVSSKETIGSITKDKYDIVFLDIEIDELNGIELAEKIRMVDKDVLIIFVTSYLDYMHEAFNKFAFNYITKPIDKNIFFKVLERAIKTVNQKKYSLENMLVLTIEKGNEILRIKYKDIIYFEKQLRKIIIYTTTNQTIKINKTFNMLEEKLQNDVFIRCHKGFIVNKYKIKSCKYGKLILEGYNTDIPIGRKYQDSIKKAIFDLM